MHFIGGKKVSVRIGFSERISGNKNTYKSSSSERFPIDGGIVPVRRFNISQLKIMGRKMILNKWQNQDI